YREEKFAEIRTAYRSFVERMFALAGLDEAAARAERVVALETDIAAAHWDNVRSRDSEATYNPMSWEDANALVPTVDIGVWLEALGVPEHSFDEVVVRQPSFVEGLELLLTADRLEAWVDWLRWQVIRS